MILHSQYYHIHYDKIVFERVWSNGFFVGLPASQKRNVPPNTDWVIYFTHSLKFDELIFFCSFNISDPVIVNPNSQIYNELIKNLTRPNMFNNELQRKLNPLCKVYWKE